MSFTYLTLTSVDGGQQWNIAKGSYHVPTRATTFEVLHSEGALDREVAELYANTVLSRVHGGPFLDPENTFFTVVSGTPGDPAADAWRVVQIKGGDISVCDEFGCGNQTNQYEKAMDAAHAIGGSGLRP